MQVSHTVHICKKMHPSAIGTIFNYSMKRKDRLSNIPVLLFSSALATLHRKWMTVCMPTEKRWLSSTIQLFPALLSRIIFPAHFSACDEWHPLHTPNHFLQCMFCVKVGDMFELLSPSLFHLKSLKMHVKALLANVLFSYICRYIKQESTD